MKVLGVVAILTLLSCSAYSQQPGSRRNHFRDFVTRLPEVDKVELLTVTPLQTDDLAKVDCSGTEVLCGAGSFPLSINAVKTESGSDASRIAALWRKLKRGEPGHCFAPDHVLRFIHGNKLLLATEVCLYCSQITIPSEGVVSISGSMEALYNLREVLIPDSSRELTFAAFKREMMPHVGREITIIGVLESGKLGWLIPFRGWQVYLYARSINDLVSMNELGRFECHTVKATGTLRYFPEPPPPAKTARPEGRAPEHFYLDVGEAKVFSLTSPHSKRSQRKL